MITEFIHRDVRIEGISHGGIFTTFIIHPYKIIFDAGFIKPSKIAISPLFVTHGHIDHAGGIATYISQRALKKLEPPDIYVPEVMIDPLTNLLKYSSELEGFEYKFKLHKMDSKVEVQINRKINVKAIPSQHRIPGNIYIVFETIKKLKNEYIGKDRNFLMQEKSKGIDLDESKQIPLIAYSGDTKIEPILGSEDCLNAKILIMECTYIDEERPVSRAREWGHIHLDEIIQNADRFRNEKILLCHFSRKYYWKYVLSHVEKKIPKSLKGRLVCFFADPDYETI